MANLTLFFATLFITNIFVCFSAPNYNDNDDDLTSFNELIKEFFNRLSKKQQRYQYDDVDGNDRIFGGINKDDHFTFCRNGAECYEFPTTKKPPTINHEDKSTDVAAVDALIKRIFDTNTDHTTKVPQKKLQNNQYSICRDREDCYVFASTPKVRVQRPSLPAAPLPAAPSPAAPSPGAPSTITLEDDTQHTDDEAVQNLLREVFKSYTNDDSDDNVKIVTKRDVATNTLQQQQTSTNQADCSDNFLQKLIIDLSTKFDIKPTPKNETDKLERFDRSVEDLLQHANDSKAINVTDLIDHIFTTLVNKDDDHENGDIDKGVDSFLSVRSPESIDDLLEKVFQSEKTQKCGTDKLCVPTKTCNIDDNIEIDVEIECNTDKICCLETNIIALPID